MKTKVLLLCLGISTILPLRAATSNGNDFALALSEASNKSPVLDDARGRPHFFRFLTISEMSEVDVDGRPGVRIVASEPASLMNVEFTVSASNSMKLLKDSPETKVGDAVAITGKVESCDEGRNTIVLSDSIVRHKDRAKPKPGKELLAEVNPSAVVYSYTEGPRPLQVEARDRDLLERKDAIMANGGGKAWFEFLEAELAKRAAARAKGGQP
ncbi:MAG: hypothetical protein ACKOLA_02030 [Spartobacteria bacterium]